MAEYQSLIWERSDAVATVTLNRPEKKNAMSRVMFDEILDVFRRAGSEEGIRCLVITGAGDSFCSGADLTDPANLVSGPIEMRERMRIVHEVASSVPNCPVPTIARVTGIAAGAGCNLALACDFVVATRSAGFAELFVKRGLVVDFGGSWALSRLLPINRAKELAMLGETLSAEEANKLGMLYKLCEDDEIDVVVKELAGKLTALPPKTVSMIKENINRAYERTLEATLDAESLTQSIAVGSRDAVEAISAWVEKREPRFEGK